jgi:hypothetical protein
MGSVNRWAPLSGIVAVAMIVVSIALIGTPDADAPGSEWTAFFEDSGNRSQMMISGLLMALSAPVFLVFFWAVSERMGSAELNGSRLSTLGLASGALFAVAVAIGGTLLGQVAGSFEFGDAPLPSPDLMIHLESLSIGVVIVGGGFFASLSVATTSIVALQSGALPGWLGWFGVVVAIVVLFSFMFIPMAAFLIWTVIVSIVQFSKTEST